MALLAVRVRYRERIMASKWAIRTKNKLDKNKWSEKTIECNIT